MKCVKCGFENVDGDNFCKNCSTKIVPPQNNMNASRNTSATIALFFTLGIILIVIIAIVVVVVINDKKTEFEDPFGNVDALIPSNSQMITNETVNINNSNELNKLNTKFKNKELTSDEYIIELSNISLYNSIEDGTYINYLIEKTYELKDELTSETLFYVYNQAMLTTVEWDVDEQYASALPTSNVMNIKEEQGKANKLSKAILTENKNFIIYYSNEGINAVSDNEAKNIGSFLENTVTSYNKNYGLEYKYEDSMFQKFWIDASNDLFGSGVISLLFERSITNASAVLLKSKIDLSYMSKAMPVYIINLEGSNVLGFYMSKSSLLVEILAQALYNWNEAKCKISNGLQGEQMDEECILNVITSNVNSSVYSVPFIVISSENISDNHKFIVAHELFHHYQKYICGDGKYGECSSGLFTTETTANFAASRNLDINKTGTVANKHAVNKFIKDISTSIDKLGGYFDEDGELKGHGYGAFVFAQNYDEVVPNGYTHLFQSMKYENALKYLYDNSGGNYKKVLLLTAERNLTLDYDNQLYLAEIDGQIYYPDNYKDLGVLDNNFYLSIDYSSMQYFYINPNKYMGENAQISFDWNSDDLSLLLFVKENNQYKALYTHALNKEFVINVSDFDAYNEVVFAVVNSSIDSSINYNIKINEIGAKIPTVTAASLNIDTLEDKINNQSSFVCHQIEENETWYSVFQVKIGFDDNNELNELYFKGTYKIKNYTKENSLAFGIAKKIVSRMFYAMKQEYSKQFKYVDTIINEGNDEYSVTFKITKNYYDALNGSFTISSDEKSAIIKAIQSDDFVCVYNN